MLCKSKIYFRIKLYLSVGEYVTDVYETFDYTLGIGYAALLYFM